MLKKIEADSYNKNLVLNYFFKLLSIVLGFISTKLILGYLGATLYGLWVTITSIISWLNSGDLGIGNGIRNELASAYAVNDKKKQEQLISSAFKIMSKIAIVLFFCVLIITEVFLRTNILQEKVRFAMYITSAFFCLNLVLGVSQSIAFGYQKSWLTSFVSALIQLFQILSILVLCDMKIAANLNFYAVINGICTTFPNIILMLILQKLGLFSKKNEVNVDSFMIKKIMETGVTFFGIQICSVILYSTDSVIINKVINSQMVAKYEVITKVYNAGNSIFSIMLIALWSAVTFHIAQNDWKWVKEKIVQLLFLCLLFSIGIIIISLNFNKLVKIWLGNSAFNFENSLVFLFGSYCIIASFCAIFSNVLNGMGVIKLQLIISIIEAVINIPLSIFFAKDLNMGIFGVKLATFICVFSSAIVLSLQTFYILREHLRRNK